MNLNQIGQKGAKTASLQTELSRLTEKMTDHYLNLLKSAQIEETSSQRSGFENNIHALQLISTSQSLLKLIHDLKYSSLIGDFETRNQVIDTQEKVLKESLSSGQQLLQTTKKQMQDALQELEEEFYHE